ncbi:hypothetical protein KUTeg_013727 [Tegillarca granosa]|uniref:RING-type domain-containing protein n=1 Tax=Tegillarca granosa TaxID=220873 RepID=A0ABQ9EUI4_TEGGR|nr:hypothetical protein KUTeg_013727 [Tegillarca granosa]
MNQSTRSYKVSSRNMMMGTCSISLLITMIYRIENLFLRSVVYKGNIHMVKKTLGNIHMIKKTLGNIHMIKKTLGNIHMIKTRFASLSISVTFYIHLKYHHTHEHILHVFLEKERAVKGVMGHITGLMASKAKRKYKKQDAKSMIDSLDPNVCVFCKKQEDNEDFFGKLIRKCDLTVHYFCMLFSSGLGQGGKTEDDVGCVVGSCRRVFHFNCGRESGTLHQFYDSYRSYCEEHRPRQNNSVSDRLSFYGTANTLCAICMMSVEARASNETLRAPCCRNSWFHRTCIQRHSTAAGLHFFKCPLCNNKEMFQAEMLKFGIYLPDQDAAWEREPNAFNELLERYTHCDAARCKCVHGRDYNKDGGKETGLPKRKKGKGGKHTPKKTDNESNLDENKAKSEYPGSSGLLRKATPPLKRKYAAKKKVSPGTVLRLSYEETDDNVVVDGDESDDDMVLSELTKKDQGGQTDRKRKKTFRYKKYAKKLKNSRSDQCSECSLDKTESDFSFNLGNRFHSPTSHRRKTVSVVSATVTKETESMDVARKARSLSTQTEQQSIEDLRKKKRKLKYIRKYDPFRFSSRKNKRKSRNRFHNSVSSITSQDTSSVSCDT